jgi:hypothetical protein
VRALGGSAPPPPFLACRDFGLVGDGGELA